MDKIKTIVMDISDVRFIVNAIKQGEDIDIDLLRLFVVNIDDMDTIPVEDYSELIDFL